MAYTPIALLERGQKYRQDFLIQEISPKKDKRGNPYLLLTFRDVTGRVKCFVWDTSIKSTSPAVQPGRYIHAEVRVDDYRGEPTLVTHNITPVKRPENIEDYVHGESEHALGVYGQELQSLIDDIDDDDIRRVIKLAVEHRDLLEDLKGCAYGTRGPLSHVGGLMVHTLRFCRTAKALMDACTDTDAPINRGLVIAACIIRNWGYTQVLEMQGDGWEVNAYGRLLGLRWASAQIARDICIDTESALGVVIDDTKKIVLQKLCFESDDSEMNVLEGKIVLAAERTVNAIQYAPRSRKMFKGHHDE